jgi:ferric-dicitrate binding protein FerR (iron transport regulator)
MYRKLVAVAAALVLFLGMAWLIRHFFFPYFGLQVVESGDCKLSVKLPDSSKVWLNKGSKLAYDPDFDDEEREVRLEGEAFFEVSPNPQRPFIVQTKRTRTTALGTSFNIRAYTPEDHVELAVASGKAAFASSDQKTEKQVTAGYTATLDSQTQGIAELPVQGGNAWAWKSGSLVFNATPLEQVLQDLERYYGIKLQLQSADLVKCRFTASFQDTDLDIVLQVLKATLQLDYQTQDNHTYTLTGKGCR